MLPPFHPLDSSGGLQPLVGVTGPVIFHCLQPRVLKSCLGVGVARVKYCLFQWGSLLDGTQCLRVWFLSQRDCFAYPYLANLLTVVPGVRLRCSGHTAGPAQGWGRKCKLGEDKSSIPAKEMILQRPGSKTVHSIVHFSYCLVCIRMT